MVVGECRISCIANKTSLALENEEAKWSFFTFNSEVMKTGVVPGETVRLTFIPYL